MNRKMPLLAHSHMKIAYWDSNLNQPQAETAHPPQFVRFLDTSAVP